MNWPSHSSSGTAAFPEEVFYRSRCEISVVNPLSKNGVTAGSLQLSPTLSMREQSAQSWSFLRYLLLPLNVRFLPGRVRCEMTAVSLQSKPAILTAGKGVGGRANANCERGDLAYGRQCRFQAACRWLDHLLGHSVLLTIVGYRLGRKA